MDLLIVAAGNGLRLGSSLPKGLYPVAGKPILSHTLGSFSRWDVIKRIVVVAHPDHLAPVQQICSSHPRCLPPVAGGATRFESVLAGLRALRPITRRVAIHDAARPLVPFDLLERLEEVSRTCPVTIPGIPLADTIKEVDEREGVLRTIPRERLRSIQTPQIFHPDVIEKFPTDANPTDEASLAEELGFPVRVVEGSLKNFKITWPEDLIIMERFLSGESE